MLKVIHFFKASYEELIQKVTWPKFEALQQSTFVILITTLLISLIIWLMDSTSGMIFKFLYSIFK